MSVRQRRKPKAEPRKHRAPSTFFALLLGQYDSSEAVATLPAQLDLLRIFRDMRRPDVALIYRFTTDPEPEGDLAPHFRFLCVGQSRDSLSSDESNSLLDHASVTFVPAWGLTHVKEPALPRATYRTRLSPIDQMALPNKPDWSPLIDLLRRREAPMAVDLICLVASPPRVDQLIDTGPFHGISVIGVNRASGTGIYPVPPADNDQKAAAFFAAVSALSQQTSHLPNLSLHLVVHSNHALDDVLSQVIGRLILGLPIQASRAYRDVIFPPVPVGPRVEGSPEEIIRAFHPPYGHIEGRGLSSFRPLSRSLRFRVSNTAGASIGHGLRQGAREDVSVPVRLSPEDRLKHIYIIGKTGSGKTNLLKNLVREDIKAGDGVAIIDPHGGLVDSTLAQVGERIDDVVLLDFSDRRYLPVVNPLLMDVSTGPDYDLAVEELIEIIIRRTYNEYTGPVFEDTVRMLLASIATTTMQTFGTPSIAAAVEIFRHSNARKWAAHELAETQPLLAEQWSTFNAMLPTTIAEQARWILAKFAEFTPDGVLYSVTGGARSDLSLSSVFRDRKILLVKIPESVIGGRAAGFLGALVFARLHRAALGQYAHDGRSTGSAPFHLHVDEFQKFVGANIEDLIAEARKFKLALTVAHQNLKQLDAFSRYEGMTSSRLREALVSNVGTMICMRMSGGDVATISEEFGLPTREIHRIAQYQALVRAVMDGQEREPFTLYVPLADREAGNRRVAAEVRRRMVAAGLWRGRGALAKEVTESSRRYEQAWKKTTRIGGGIPQRRKPPQGEKPAKGPKPPPGEASFLDEWLAKRESRIGSATDRVADQSESDGKGEPDPRTTQRSRTASRGRSS